MNSDKALSPYVSSSERPGTSTRGQAGWLMILALITLAGAGCGGFGMSITGSGHTVTKDYDLAGFSRISAGHAFNIEIAQGAKHSVSVTVDDNLVEFLDVGQSGETLRIQMQNGVSFRNATMKATIAMPELTGVDLSGAVKTRVTGFSSDKSLDVELSGASNLHGEIKNGDARVEVSGASKVELKGSAGKLKIDASGASSVNFDDYRSGDTTVQASGASHVTVNAGGVLDADASGASSVRYVGEPSRVNSHTSGASSVRKK